MSGAISRGLTLRDFEDLSLGQIVDYCKTYNDTNKEKDEKKENKTRKAGQSDFDRF